MTTAEGTFNLRPRTIGELLDQAIRLYRKNFLTFIGIIALMQVPLTLFQLVIQYIQITMLDETITSLDPSISDILIGSFVPGILLSVAQLVLIGGFATAALTRAIGDSFLGEQTGIFDAYKKIGESWRALVGALFVYAILVILFFVWAMIPCVGWLTGPGMVGFLAFMVSPFIAPAVVLEKRSAGKALKRAWNLGMKRFWWLLGFAFILTLFSYVIVSGPVVLIQLISDSPLTSAGTPGDFGSMFTWQLIVQTLLGMILGLLFFPLSSAGYILAYFDLRVRYEGFDLALLARQTGGENINAGELSTLGVAPSENIKIGANQIGYFIGLSLLLLVVFFVLYFVLALVFAGSMGLMSGL